MIVAITGKSGSGKSTLSNILKNEMNSLVIDIDKIGHIVNTFPSVIENVRNTFGSSVINKNGEIERKKLGAIVFSDNNEMQKLYDITWPEMKRVIFDEIEKNKNKIVVLDYALLPITDIWNKCDVKVFLDVPKEERIRRIQERDKLPIEYIEKRENSAVDYSFYDFDIILTDTKESTVNNFKNMIDSKYHSYIAKNNPNQ